VTPQRNWATITEVMVGKEWYKVLVVKETSIVVRGWYGRTVIAKEDVVGTVTI